MALSVALASAPGPELVLILPQVNPFRDPRYGRGQETPGEDAWVNAELATQYVLGLQDGPANGTHRAQRLRATAACKHIFIYDGQSGVDVNVSTRDLHDYYMQPWHSCAAVGHSASMMCSYGAINVSEPPDNRRTGASTRTGAFPYIYIIRNARIDNVCKSQSCMVSK